ncbi:8890_t:CDS:2 [Racocetra fulgida]|uniref:8890_t:CDS:1 n=2 Tax=Racocetra TaxID=940663 RepID=A0A9N8W3Z8_9GLOM|nr:8890_t:CDS:2 [Racocetra fulgida]
MPHFINFPFEIIVDICSYIDLYSLNALALSCKDLTFVLKHPPLWRHIRFINLEEQIQIEKQFLSPLNYTTFQIPYKLSRVDDRRARQLLNIDALTEGEKYLYEKLSKKFQPTKLNVQDISGGCGSMYAIEISSSVFKGLPMIKQHRMVNELLEDDIKKMHGIRVS